MDFDVPDLAFKIIPIIIVIAKTILEYRVSQGEKLTPQEEAAIGLFNALLVYVEAMT